MHASHMTEKQFYDTLKERFSRIIGERGIASEKILIDSKALTAEEAIGITKRKDFPILTGKEVLLQARYQEAVGQAFTDSPSVFRGTLDEILQLDLVNDQHARGLFIASLNAVMRSLSLADRTVHCKNGEPELCAEQFVQYVKEHYGSPKIALVGFQPALLDHLAREFDVRALDLNPDHVGTIQYHTLIEHGETAYQEVVNNWAELVLCTGSTLCNGTIVNYLGIDREVLFFGTSLSGAAELLGLKRLCFCAS